MICRIICMRELMLNRSHDQFGSQTKLMILEMWFMLYARCYMRCNSTLFWRVPGLRRDFDIGEWWEWTTKLEKMTLHTYILFVFFNVAEMLWQNLRFGLRYLLGATRGQCCNATYNNSTQFVCGSFVVTATLSQKKKSPMYGMLAINSVNNVE